MKRLYRPRQERILGGVCSGLGRHYDTDPVLVRLGWVLLTILSFGCGIILYIVAWIIVPEEDPVLDAEPSGTIEVKELQ
jgi:phage shock protein PspC (stress-responsive transcriptional regulator)